MVLVWDAVPDLQLCPCGQWKCNLIPIIRSEVKLASILRLSHYTIPSTPDIEIAVIIPDSNDSFISEVVCSTREGPQQKIRDLSPHYDALHYVLLFPRGILGWCQVNVSEQSNKRIPTSINKQPTEKI